MSRIGADWHAECTSGGAAVLGKKAMGEALLESVFAEFAQIRDSRGPLTGSLVFWSLFDFHLTGDSFAPH